MKGATVFFDLETGGLRPEAPTIQIAAVAVLEWRQLDSFEVKIRFDEAAADPEALALNHYDPEVWRRDAVLVDEALATFADFLRLYPDIDKVSARGRPYRVARLAGHNVAAFDAPRLVDAFKRRGLFLPADAFRPLDTLQLALWRLCGSPSQPSSYKLGALCEHLGIATEGAHDALADVRMCVELARALAEGR